MEEDDMDFTISPNTSSNLASLFGINKTPQGNSSLTYTAPKAPNKESSPIVKQSSEKNIGSKRTIIISKAVQAYKLENRTYVHQGLTGIVISGNYELHIYEIILYKPNKEYICNINLSRNFSLTLSPNNYASFYDDQKQNWSVMFQTPLDIAQFARKLAVCKFYCHSDLSDSILTQDLTPMTQEKATVKNTVDIIYDVQSITLGSESKLKDDIKERINLSQYSFTPLSNGLVGCSENSKRIIIVPYSLSDIWLDKLDFNAHLLLEVKVEKIISGSANSTSQSKLSVNPPENPVDSSAEDSSIKARGVSIKEALTNTKCQKANLISRMARMGQATLPVKQGLTGGPSDSEEECSVTSVSKSRLPRNRIGATASQTSQAPKSESQQLSVYQNDITWQQAQLAKLGVTYQPIIPVSASPISSPTTDPNFSMYVSESRIQAAELRMGISKMSEKLDLVWNKLQNLNFIRNEDKLHQLPLMDPSGILSNIQGLISENEQLKIKVNEQREKIEEQNQRIFKLFELNHRYLEQNSTTQVKQSENELKLKAELERLNLKEIEFETERKKSSENIKILEGNLAKAQEVEKDLNKKIEELKRETDILKTNLQGGDDLKRRELENFEEKMFEATEMITKLKEKLKEVVLENENLKSMIQVQREEIETKKGEVKDSKLICAEFEKEVEGLKKQISEEELKSQLKIEDLTKVVTTLEEENKFLKLQIKKRNTEEDEKNKIVKVLSKLKEEFSEDKEYSTAVILSKIEDSFQEGCFTISRPKDELLKEKKIQESSKETEQNTSEKSIVVPSPRASIQNIKVVKTKNEESKVLEPEENFSSWEGKEKDEKEKPEDNQNEKKESGNRHKTYDQSWRTTKPPPLFDDEDDDDAWLN